MSYIDFSPEYVVDDVDEDSLTKEDLRNYICAYCKSRHEDNCVSKSSICDVIAKLENCDDDYILKKFKSVKGDLRKLFNIIRIAK